MQADSSYCFDLIARITASRLLILELKFVKASGRLRSPDRQQESLLVALRNLGIPILYAYNTRQTYPDDESAAAHLSATRTALPGRLSRPGGHLVEDPDHRVLRDVVDELASDEPLSGATGGNWAHGSNIVHLFDRQLLDAGSQQFTTRFLVFAYNRKAQELIHLDSEGLGLLYRAYLERVSLQQDLDLNAPLDAIERLFAARRAELDHLIDEVGRANRLNAREQAAPEPERPNTKRVGKPGSFDLG
jgi:hypothetical protein